MPEPIVPQAEVVPQTGEAEWFPPVEDDAEGQLKPREPRGIRWVFYGADGLRAGWSLLLFALFAAALGFVFGRVAHRFFPVPRHLTEMPVWVTLLNDGFLFLTVGLAAFFVSLVERRRFARYGLGSLRGRVGQFVAGLVVGGGLLSLLVLALKVSGLLVFTGAALSGGAVVKWGALWLLAFLAVGFAEEYVSRGFVQFTLARGLAGIGGALGMETRARRVAGFWAAALFFSFLFGFGHKGNPGESPIGLWSAGLIALVFAFSLWRSGSLWWAIGFHAAWDWAQSFVYGTADSGLMVQNHWLVSHPVGSPLRSGGLTGPEGSLYVLVAIALATVAVAVMLPSEAGSPSDTAYTPDA